MWPRALGHRGGVHARVLLSRRIPLVEDPLVELKKGLDEAGTSVIKRGICCTSSLGRNPTIVHEFHDYIKWARPEKLKTWDPQRSCDLRPLPKINPDWLKVEYRPFSHIIEALPKEDQRLFTVGVGRRGDGVKVILEDTLQGVRRHTYDRESIELKVAWMTIQIRNYQELLTNSAYMRKQRNMRVSVKELIEKRKKWLSRLKNLDYKRFEWLIHFLNILYKPRAPNGIIRRKDCLTWLTEMLCNSIKEQKLNEYKMELEAQKIPFLKEKLEALRRIKEDENSLNIPCSVEDEIFSTEKRLEALEGSHMVIHPLESNSTPALESGSMSPLPSTKES